VGLSSEGAVIAGGGAAGSANTIGANSGFSTVGGGGLNTILSNTVYSTIAGGNSNQIGANSAFSVIGGGLRNDILDSSLQSLISGDRDNLIGTNCIIGVVAGGSQNQIQRNADGAAILGGFRNKILGNAINRQIAPVIVGGSDHNIGADSDFTAILGGDQNGIGTNASFSTIIGGNKNVVGNNAQYSYAAGQRAKANHTGTFVWADSTDADLASTGTNQFLIRASGGVGIGTGGHSINAQLHVQANGARVAKFDRYDSDGELVAWARNDSVVGNVTVAAGVVSYNAFTGSHYSWCDTEPEPGMLMTLTGVNRHILANRSGEIIYGVKPSAVANDPACLGTYVTTTPVGDLAGNQAVRLVAAVGNGDLWVINSGRDIRPGDLLISSDIAGCAMLDDATQFPIGHVVARAAEAVAWDDVRPQANGVQKVKVSVLFNPFTRAPLEPLNLAKRASLENATEMAGQRDTEIAELKARLEKLEQLLEHVVNGSGK